LWIDGRRQHGRSDGPITAGQIADLACFIARIRKIRAVARWHCHHWALISCSGPFS
jgi:hypothetical protein